MKQMLTLIVLVQIFTSFSYEWIPGKAKREFKITFEKVFVTKNPCVGDDWIFSMRVGNKTLKELESIDIVLEDRSPLTIIAEATEEDEAYPDFGSNKLGLTYSDLIAIEKNRFEIEVIVEENGGPNSGCIAIVKFWVEVKQLSK